MKAQGSKIIATLLMMGIALSQVGCDNAVFSDDGSRAKTTAGAGGTDIVPEVPQDPPTPLVVDDLVFLDDSFERDDIYADIANSIIYGWRGFILDGANAVLSFQSNGAGARIPPAGQLGPAAQGERFLLLEGRDNTTEVETVHVIAQTFDLTQYNTALLTFRYLTFGLNDADDTVPENLRVQVCRGSLNDCGVNDDALNTTGLQSDNWVTVFTSPNLNDDALNGKNHTAADWQAGVLAIDLRDPAFVGDASTFVFRFVGTMRDGATPGVCTDPDGDGGDNHSCSCKCKHKCHSDNGKHKGFDHSKHYGYGKHDCKGKHKCKHKCKDDQYKNCEKKCRELKETALQYKKMAIEYKQIAQKYKHCAHKDCKDKNCHDQYKQFMVKYKHKWEMYEHYMAKYKKCKKECQHKCKDKCDDDNQPPVCTEPDGTLKDGIAIDQVKGLATQRTIDEIF